MDLEEVVFRPHWIRTGVGRYELIAEYLNGTPETIARIEGSGREWIWYVRGIWRANPKLWIEKGDPEKSKRSAQFAAERFIVDEIGPDPTWHEIREHNNKCRQNTREHGLPLPYPKEYL